MVFHYAIQALLMVLFLANVATILRGLNSTFVTGTPTWHGWLIRIGSPISWLAGLVAMAAAPSQRPGEQLVAVAAFLGSFFMFRAATRATEKNRFTWAFSTDIPNHLVRTGPYKWVRHPFYCSYLMLAWGSVFATYAKAWVIAPVLMLSCIYRFAIHVEERKFANSPLAESYAVYRTEVGMLLPSLRSLRSSAHEQA